MTRDDLIVATRQLIDEGTRLQEAPSLASLQSRAKYPHALHSSASVASGSAKNTTQHSTNGTRR